MKSLLLAETSATRRKALSTLLEARGFLSQNVSGPEQAFEIVRNLQHTASDLSAVVLGWPEYPEAVTEDVFSLLKNSSYEHLPVLVLADWNDGAALNWTLSRPRTALVMWADYQEAPQALTKLLDNPESSSLDRAPEQESNANMRILFVDDSATVRLAYARLLTKEGYQVEVANSVAEGSEKLRESKIDIAVVDYFMPEQNGPSLISIMKRNPATAHIISAILTGTYSDSVIRESLAAGATECMFKNEAKELFLARVNSLARTVRDRKTVENERERLDGILSSVGDGVYGVDTRGLVKFVNPAALNILGLQDAGEIINHSAHESFHFAFEDGTPILPSGCYLSACYANGESVPNWQTTFWSVAKRPIPVECTIYPMVIGGVRQGSVVAFRDVSMRRLLEDELRWQATHDSLTKLHNRAWFEAELELELARLKRSEHSCLLLFVDVDRFKYINDTAGHAAGDKLLQEVSERLRSRLRASDHLARMGGDEYALILRNISGSDPEVLSDGFRKALTTSPFSYAGKNYRITVSIGAARMDRNTPSSQHAMANADIACHIAKNGGRNRIHVYSPETDERAAMDADLGWSHRLETALKQNGFALNYQAMMPVHGLSPHYNMERSEDMMREQFELNPKCPHAFEVLIRLKDGNGGLIAPDAFLPTAERFGMMVEIDKWVIDNALRALRDSVIIEPKTVISINLSAQTLSNVGISQYVTDKLVEHRIDGSNVIFEITESRALTNIDLVRELIAKLRALGCAIAVDDFGTGFSTFAYLKHLDADYLKLDGSLIQGLPNDPLDIAVVRAISTVAKAAGKITIAECVESMETLRALRECGIDWVQGYGIARPRHVLGNRVGNNVIPVRALANQNLSA